jgi:transcriptional regulator with XRE-family HTH domain
VVEFFSLWSTIIDGGGAVMSVAKTSALETYAAQLRAWRKKRGWTQLELAAKICYSDALVSMVELTSRTPSLDFAKRCDSAFDAPDTFEQLHGLVSREAWPSYYAPVVNFELQAVRIHQWELRVIPGLLQTQDYARSVIRAGNPRIAQAELDRKVDARLDRQRILERDKPPMFWVVLYEGALRHLIGGPAVMGAQLDRLIAADGSPDIVIQVLPFTAYDHPGTDGPIQVFDLPDSTSVAYMECNGGGMLTEAPEAVADVMTTLNMIRAAALPPRESMALLRQIRSEIVHD